MSNVMKISDYIGKWREVYSHEDKINGTMLVAYVNDRTKELDIVQTNSDGESITTHFNEDHGLLFITNLSIDAQ